MDFYFYKVFNLILQSAKKINQAKTPEDAEFWADILDKIMQHNQKKTINEKFKI